MNDNFATLKIEDRPVIIPDNVIVPCPKSGKQVSRLAVSCCPDCEFFRGLGKLTWADTPEEQAQIDNMPFSKRYSIRCETVMEWTLSEFET